MDTFTHGLVPFLAGKVLGRSRTECAALLLGGLAPDFDVFIMWIPLFFQTSVPFTHRGITHTIIFGFVTAAIALFIASRKHVQNVLKHAFKTDTKLEMLPSLLAFAYIGTLSHFFLDWLTTYGIALLYPLTLKRYSFELFFYIDFYLTILSMALIGYAVFMKFKRKAPAAKIQAAYKQMFVVLISAILLLGGLRYYEKSAAADYFGTSQDSVFPSPSPFEWSVYDAAKGNVYLFDSLQKKVTGEYPFSDTNPNRFNRNFNN